MDTQINEARIARLRAWINEDFGGKVAGFCRQFRLPPSTASYISQLFSGNRNFGEKAARQMEEQCGLPAGWFDQDVIRESPNRKETPLFLFDRDRVARLSERERELISTFVEFVVHRSEKNARLKTPQLDVERKHGLGPKRKRA